MDICYQQVVKKPALGKTKGKTSVFNDSMSYACSSHLVELKVFILRMVNLQVSANFNKETTNSVAAECCLIGTYWNDLSWSIWRGSNPNDFSLPEQFTNLTWWASYFWFECITTWSLNLFLPKCSKSAAHLGLQHWKLRWLRFWFGTSRLWDLGKGNISLGDMLIYIGGFSPSEKILVKMGIFSPNWDENFKNYLKPPLSYHWIKKKQP